MFGFTQTGAKPRQRVLHLHHIDVGQSALTRQGTGFTQQALGGLDFFQGRIHPVLGHDQFVIAQDRFGHNARLCFTQGMLGHIQVQIGHLSPRQGDGHTTVLGQGLGQGQAPV